MYMYKGAADVSTQDITHFRCDPRFLLATTHFVSFLPKTPRLPF